MRSRAGVEAGEAGASTRGSTDKLQRGKIQKTYNQNEQEAERVFRLIPEMYKLC